MSEIKQKARDALIALRDENPSFHGREMAGSQNYSIGRDVLEWMLDSLPAHPTTLETGCGYTTVILAAMGSRHTIISPFSEEHVLIKEWCNNHDIPCAKLDFIAEVSQRVLPSLRIGDLDLALIDGDHAFPAPFIDWYYVADRVRNGGYVAIDDTQIPTGALLRTFLSTETTRWRRAVEMGRTVIFQRITEERVAEGIAWTEQPFCRVTTTADILIRIKSKIGKYLG